MFCFFISGAITVVKKPSLPDFPVENEPYEVICQIYGTLETGKFIDRNNQVIQDSVDGNRKFTKVTSINISLLILWFYIHIISKRSQTLS